MLLPLPAVTLFAILTGPPQPLGYSIGVFAFAFGFSAMVAAFFAVKGWRKRGRVVEIYERGLRFGMPPASDAAFLFAEVRELKKRTIRGALANLTFVLTDGRTYTADVNNSNDAAMLQDVLARFGPVRWEADRGFRVL